MSLTVSEILELEKKFRELPPPRPSPYVIVKNYAEAEYFRKRGVTVYMKK